MVLSSLEEISYLLSEHEQALRHYVELLVEANGRVRLTGPGDQSILWNEHLLDCLHLIPLLPRTGKLIDVGTGGGLPGVVVALCRPELEVTLLDSQAKKAREVAMMITTLNLTNALVVAERSEDVAARYRESWDVAVARAVSEAPVLAEYLSPLVRPGGRLLAMKGPAWQDEVAGLGGRWSELGLSEPYVAAARSDAGTSKVILTWDKVAPCGKRYPRRPGRAEKIGWWKRT